MPLKTPQGFTCGVFAFTAVSTKSLVDLGDFPDVGFQI